VSSGGTLRYHDRGFHRINPRPRHHPWCRGPRLATSAAGYEERITSTDNATVKHFAKLVRNRGYREECGSIVVAGSGILSEVCAGGGGDAVGSARVLFLADDACVPAGVTASRIVRAPEHVLKKAAGLQSVDRVDAVAELSMPPVVGVAALQGAGRIARLLALDGIQDPGNLGTLVRTALALGWDAVALLPGTCDPYNDKALRAARGGVFRMPMARLTWEELEEVTRRDGLRRFCAEPTADATAADTAATGSKGLCLVLGSEGQGLSDVALRTCEPVAIPMPGEMESLNVAVAGGILLYLMRRGS